MFERWLEIDPNKSCLVIGPRRSGKTTLLKNRFSNLSYATLDDLDDLDWAKQDPKGFISKLGSRAIIDEIQRLPILTIVVTQKLSYLPALHRFTARFAQDAKYAKKRYVGILPRRAC